MHAEIEISKQLCPADYADERRMKNISEDHETSDQLCPADHADERREKKSAEISEISGKMNLQILGDQRAIVSRRYRRCTLRKKISEDQQ